MSTDLKAPAGKFRVVGVDTFDSDGSDWLEGDFDTLADARKAAQIAVAGTDMTKMHIYDDTGRHLDQYGKY